MQATQDSASVYPIRIRMSAATLAELEHCEYGSYEDCKGDAEHLARSFGEDARIEDHPVSVIANSKKTVLIIRNAAQADWMFYAVCSGTFQLHHLRVAQRIADALIQHATPETVARWRYPDGF